MPRLAERHSGTISLAAQRFSARVRARRRARLGAVAVALVALAGLGYLVFGSPLLTVRQIRIEGLARVPVAGVHAVTDAELGRPLANVDADAVARRLVGLPLIRTARVVRRWPDTLVVTVAEREPAAVVAAPGGGFRLLDRDGVEVERSASRPAGLPVLDVDLAVAGPGGLRAALEVLSGLPGDLRAGLIGIGATSPDGVWFSLAKRGKVVWGSSEAGDAKAVALRALLAAAPGTASVFDVSAPTAPAVRPGR